MADGLVKLVQTTIATVALSAMLSCNPPSGLSYSNTPIIPDKNADVAESVILSSGDSYEPPQKQTINSNPCQHLSFMECMGYGIGETSKYMSRFSP